MQGAESRDPTSIPFSNKPANEQDESHVPQQKSQSELSPAQKSDEQSDVASQDQLQDEKYLSTSDQPTVEGLDSLRREKRLAMNRESARNRRKRKKQLIHNLESQVNELTIAKQQYQVINESLNSRIRALEHELMVSRTTISQLSALIQRGVVGSQRVDQMAPNTFEHDTFSNWGPNMLGDIQQQQQLRLMQPQLHERTMSIHGPSTSRLSGDDVPSLMPGTSTFSTTMPQMDNPGRHNIYEQLPLSQSIQGSNLASMITHSPSDDFPQVPPFLGFGFGQSGPGENTFAASQNDFSLEDARLNVNELPGGVVVGAPLMCFSRDTISGPHQNEASLIFPPSSHQSAENTLRLSPPGTTAYSSSSAPTKPPPNR